MIYIIIGSVFVLAMVLFSIYARKSNVESIPLLENEEMLWKQEGITVESFGMGPQSKVFPGCVLQNTNLRLIVAQKIPLSKKLKIHYHLWKDSEHKQDRTIENGMIHLLLHPEKVRHNPEEKELILSFGTSPYIRSLNIKNVDPSLSLF